MRLDPSFALLAICVLVASTTQTLAGFGGIVIALTLGASLYPIEALLPVLVPLSLCVTGYIVLRHGGHVDRRLLLRGILPGMGVGLAIGLLVFETVQGAVLERVYGTLVACFAARELWRLARSRPAYPGGAALRVELDDDDALVEEDDPAAPLGPVCDPHRAGGLRRIPLIVMAGVIQGVYASGGPLLVYAVSKAGLTKATFRATLCTVWLALNTTLTVAYVATGRLRADTLPFIGALLPVVVGAILLGEWGHARVDERRFKAAVYVVLLVAGGSIIFTGG